MRSGRRPVCMNALCACASRCGVGFLLCRGVRCLRRERWVCVCVWGRRCARVSVHMQVDVRNAREHVVATRARGRVRWVCGGCAVDVRWVCGGCAADVRRVRLPSAAFNVERAVMMPHLSQSRTFGRRGVMFATSIQLPCLGPLLGDATPPRSLRDRKALTRADASS